jgi:hypothetical protein
MLRGDGLVGKVDKHGGLCIVSAVESNFKRLTDAVQARDTTFEHIRLL